jgi:hypothetical protein
VCASNYTEGLCYRMVKDQTGSYIFSTSNRPRPISFLPPSPPNRGHLSASTPSPSGLAPVYKSVAAASFYRYRYRFTAHIIFSMRGVRGNAREFSGAVQNVHRVFRVFMTRYGGGCRTHTPAMPLRGASLPPLGVRGHARCGRQRARVSRVLFKVFTECSECS